MLHVLHLSNHLSYLVLAATEFDRTLLLPEGLVAHHRLGIGVLRTKKFEVFLGYIGGTVVTIVSASFYLKFGQEAGEFQLYNHLVACQQLFSAG